MIGDYNLYLYWVSVFLRMQSFTVRFKTRIHHHHLCTAVMGQTQIRALRKYVFHHYLANIIYAPQLWDKPKSAPYANMCFIIIQQTSFMHRSCGVNPNPRLTQICVFFGRFCSFSFSGRLIFVLPICDVFTSIF